MVILSWIAITVLSTSYFVQIYSINKHKEVRDLSLPYHVLFALGTAILTYTAHMEGSTIFVVKQFATLLPVLVVIGQIIYHRKDQWEDSSDIMCETCHKRLKAIWSDDHRSLELKCLKCDPKSDSA